MGEWQHGLLGCFSNCGICICTFFLPCYVHGKTAEAVGDSCFCCCLAMFIPIVDLIALAVVRGKVRDQKGISGSFLCDLVAAFCCPFCVVIQSAAEVNAMGSMASMAIDRV